jgi:hypothetical protein
MAGGNAVIRETLFEAMLDHMVENGAQLPLDGTEEGAQFVSAVIRKMNGRERLA